MGAGRQYSLAACAGEALLVVSVAERGDDFALDVLVAGGAARAERALVVLRAVVVAVLAEEAAAREGRGARAAREARRVEVLVRHAQHLAAALAAARRAHHLACATNKHYHQKHTDKRRQGTNTQAT